MTEPETEKQGCTVTMYNESEMRTVDVVGSSGEFHARKSYKCGEPVVSRGLCLHHLAERKRLLRGFI